jgi:hypothetical protein
MSVVASRGAELRESSFLSSLSNVSPALRELFPTLPADEGLETKVVHTRMFSVNVMESLIESVSFPMLQPPDDVGAQGITIGVSAREVGSKYSEPSSVDVTVVPPFRCPTLPSADEGSFLCSSHRKEFTG